MTTASRSLIPGLLGLLFLVTPPMEAADQEDSRDRLLSLLPEREQTARAVLLAPTLMHSLSVIPFEAPRRSYEFLLDRIPLATKIARRLFPPLERYTVSETRPGLYQVEDQGALRGKLHLLLIETDRRVYLAEGQFRSLANLLTITGRVIILLEYREGHPTEAGRQGIVTAPVLYLKIDNIVIHSLGKLLPPLLRGIIERRSASLTTAAAALGERMAQDPYGLYQEMEQWREVTESEREAYRQIVLAAAPPTEERQ